VFPTVEVNVTPNPVKISLLGAVREMSSAHLFPRHLVQTANRRQV
jgi:hypothetical protein